MRNCTLSIVMQGVDVLYLNALFEVFIIELCSERATLKAASKTTATASRLGEIDSELKELRSLSVVN